MKKYIALTSRAETLDVIRRRHCGNDSKTQTRRFLEALQLLGSISTIEAYRYLDILHPPARKLDLVKLGYAIDLTWVREASLSGRMHRIGRYLYRGPTSYPLFDDFCDQA